ncbi:MAG: glycosyltransferase family 39 protein [Anaerolineae bacterium]|nr:glycosyltransferase family 39 protein [Anaerolineae bacterium]
MSVFVTRWLNSVSWQKLRTSPWVVLLGVGFLSLGQWRWLAQPEALRPGVIPALAGVALLVLALRPAEVGQQPEPLTDPAASLRYIWQWRVLIALAGIGLSVYTGCRAAAGVYTAWDLLLVWSISIWLTIYGLVPHETAVKWWGALWRSSRDERRTWLVVALIFVVGLVVRTAWLETSPYIQAGDEASFAIQAVAIKNDLHWRINPFEYGVWHHPYLYHILIAISIELFGQTIAAARLASAILGALTVPAVYLMGRRLFDRRVGLVAAIFMAAYPLHVQFSRTGINQVGDPLFTALTFAFLTRALRDNDHMEAALAGLALGLSQYFYSAARIVPFLMLVYVGLYALRDWRVLRRRAGVLLVMACVAWVVTFPNTYAVLEDGARSISPRLAQVSIWETGDVSAAASRGHQLEYWGRQIQRSFMAYVQTHDESDFYGRYNPVLGWCAGVPFIIGLMIALRRWRDPRFSILVIWVVATAILGGVLLIDPPHYSRYISVTPGLAVLVALGVIMLGETLGRAAVGLRGLLPGAAAYLTWLPVALVVVLALEEQSMYIVDYLPQKLVYGEPTVQLNEVADLLGTFGGRYEVWYLSSPDLDMGQTNLLPYQSPDNAGREYMGDVDLLRETLTTHGAHAFLIAPDRFEDVIEALLSEAPDGTLREYTNPRTGAPLVYVYFVDIP